MEIEGGLSPGQTPFNLDTIYCFAFWDMYHYNIRGIKKEQSMNGLFFVVIQRKI
jgi:hypothetical protein